MERTDTTNKRLLGRLKATAASRFGLTRQGFREDEEGGIAIISFFIFLLMLTMGGISIDLMRHEMERTQLQATLDSAVLAGGGAPAGATKADIKAIVEDFFVKSGKGEFLNTIGDDDIIATLNSRKVAASASMTMRTYLMRLMGVETLSAGGGATAEVRTPKLEVVIVLDVSGSMAGSKLTNLKTAAKEFVTTILSSSDPGSTVISIIPFSWGVTPTQGIFEALTIDQTHEYSTCLYFEDADYETAAISPTTMYKQRIYTSVYGTSFDGVNNGSVTNGWSAAYNRTCFTDEYFQILPFSISESALHAKIESLQAAGSTSAHLGMKWAAGMLDPAFGPVIASLQTPRAQANADGTVSMITEMNPSLTNIPSSYTEHDTQKVIVIMGDGQNDSTYMFTAPGHDLDRSVTTVDVGYDYRGANSYLHKVVATEEVFDYAYDQYDPSRQWHQSWAESYCYLSWLICVYETTSVNNHFVYKPSNGYYYPVDGGSAVSSYSFNNWVNGLPATYTDENGVEQDTHTVYDWEEAWGKMTPRFVGDLTGNWAPYNNFVGNEQTTSVKDDKMGDICAATKAKGVRVYSIGFEIPEESNAEQHLRACATDTNFYYRASGVSISDAFGSIASNVQNLRLTQ